MLMKTNSKIATGLMSGTSLDGVDAVLVSIANEGLETQVEVLEFISYPIDDLLKTRILKNCVPETSSVAEITSLNVELGLLWCDAVDMLLSKSNYTGHIDFIASHGQTIYHQPKAEGPLVPSTLQIGDPSALAYRFKTDVVFNFRMMDMVDGGDGAPLVPYSEFILYRSDEKTTLLQNIGGIGNVTVIPKNATIDDVTAFDTGPGNMMINAATHYFYGKAYDKDGTYAKQGILIPELFDELISHEYLTITPPKSTGREMFGEDVVNEICQRYSDVPNDVIATLTHFTAYSITDAYKRFIIPNTPVDRVVLGGGGAYNPELVRLIKDYLSDVEVLVQEDLGYSSDAKEAIAFAVLGNETLYRQTSNVPNATGAQNHLILGQISPNPWANNL